MRTRQKRVATDTWRSLGCRTTLLEHWSRRKPTAEPRWAKQQTKKPRPKPTKINSPMSGSSLSLTPDPSACKTKEGSKATNRDRAKHQARRPSHYTHATPNTPATNDNPSEPTRKTSPTHNLSESTHQVPTKLRPRQAPMQKRPQSNTEPRNQPTVSAIKLGEGLSKFTIPTAPLEKSGSQTPTTGIEINHMTRHSSKPNKLRNTSPARGRTGNATIQKWKTHYTKTKAIATITNPRRNKSV